MTELNTHVSTASVATDKAARYMVQLSKHWAHKFPVTGDEATSRIELPIGVCLLSAGLKQLGVVVEAASVDDLPRLEEVVASHLNRFAFREGELAFDWIRA